MGLGKLCYSTQRAKAKKKKKDQGEFKGFIKSADSNSD